MGNDPSVPKEQLIYDCACIYNQNPDLWNQIIANTRLKHKPAASITTTTPVVEEESSKGSKKKNGMRNESVVGLSREIVQEINKVRSNPSEYVIHLQSRYDSFVDDFVYKLSSDEYLRTKEGKQCKLSFSPSILLLLLLTLSSLVILETIKVLEATSPLPPMIESTFLEESAIDHVSDLIVNNIFSHTGSDGSSLKDRIERYCLWRGSLGENMDFGSNNATEIVVNLLIDDGVATRGHRKNILHPDYRYVGAALGPHPIYHFCCVMDFTTKVVGYDQILKKDLTKSLKTMDDLKNEDIVKLFLTVPYNGDLESEVKEQLQADAQVLMEFSAAQKSLRISFVQAKKTLTRTLSWA